MTLYDRKDRKNDAVATTGLERSNSSITDDLHDLIFDFHHHVSGRSLNQKFKKRCRRALAFHLFNQFSHDRRMLGGLWSMLHDSAFIENADGDLALHGREGPEGRRLRRREPITQPD